MVTLAEILTEAKVAQVEPPFLNHSIPFSGRHST